MKRKLLMVAIALLGVVIHSKAQVVAYSEDFETATVPALATGWSGTVTGGGNGWVTHIGPTRWRITDVMPHSTYALVDDHSQYFNNPAKLTSPIFSLVGLSNPYLSFDCAYLKMSPIFGSPGEQVWIDISTDGGATYTTIDTLPALSGQWSPYYKSLASVTPSANCRLRFCYSDVPGVYGEGMNGVAIDNIRVFDPATTDAGLGWVIPEPGVIESYVNVGDSVTFSGLVTNAGTTGISSFTINYQAGASAPVSQYFSTACASFANTYYTVFSFRYHVTATGPQPIKFWITVPGDTNPVNDTARTVVTGVTPDIPVKRMFIEELTGTWCSWCVRGIIYMDSLWKEDSNKVNIVSVHSKITQDAMANDNVCTRSYDTFTLAKSGLGYPSAIVDRRRVSPVQYGFSDFETDKKYFGFASMGVMKSATGSTLIAKATVRPEVEFTGDYRLELIVTEEEVTGTDVYYQQANAYSGSSTPMEGCGYNFNDSAALIPPGHLKFHFVDRYTIPNRLVEQQHGVPGSLPTTMHAGAYYSYTFDPISIQSNWNASRLRCIVLLIDNNVQSPNYGYVLNAANTAHPPLVDPAAVFTDAMASQELSVYPNPANEDVTVSFVLQEAGETSLCIFDGMGRKIISTTTQQRKAGEQLTHLPIKTLPAGIYNVVLTTSSGRVSALLSVVK